jgi:dTMP kinase
MANKKGLIVYFDGPDGVGKTTQLELTVKALQAEGHDVYETRTVGGTPVGELLRLALLSDTERPAETDLHIALASQHALARDVTGRRERGQVVLIDRSPLSIVGYQVYGDGLDRNKGYQATGELLDLFQPDLIIVYKAPDAVLVNRREHRNHHTGTDHFENKSNDYHHQVAEGFADASRLFGAKVIDGGQSIDEVQAETIRYIESALKA